VNKLPGQDRSLSISHHWEVPQSTVTTITKVVLTLSMVMMYLWEKKFCNRLLL
jgi:hypothetical protein